MYLVMENKDLSRSLIQPELQSVLAGVSKLLQEQGIASYLVGGLVRDVLLRRDTSDIDIAVAGDALEVAAKVAGALGGRYVLLDKVNKIGRVIILDRKVQPGKVSWELDFSSFEGSIEQDLARRDFTINALALDMARLDGDSPHIPLIDPFSGENDLRQGIIRAVTATIFASDAARLLRAVRLAAELNFSIDEQTEALIQHHAALVAHVAGERIREELLKLLAVSRGGEFLSYLDEVGLLTAIFPELAQAKGFAQPPEHFWDVFEHSLKVVTAADFLLRQTDWGYVDGDVLAAVPWSAELAQHFDREVSCGSTRRVLLKLAALLHDVAKPQTRTVDAGRIRFLGHAQEGAGIVSTMLERLRFSAKEIKLVETEVRHHLRPGQITQSGLPTHRAIYRYFRDTGEAGIDVLFLSLADHLATRGPKLILSHWQEHTAITKYVLACRLEDETIIRPPKLVDGHDLINIFGLSPGPRIAEILEALHEAQASAEVTNREEALAYIRSYLSR